MRVLYLTMLNCCSFAEKLTIRSLFFSWRWHSMCVVGGAAVMTNLVDGLSIELATGLVAAVIGSYTFIGGLGATFYVSYFNTALIYIIMIIFLVKIYQDGGNPDNPLGNVVKMTVH